MAWLMSYHFLQGKPLNFMVTLTDEQAGEAANWQPFGT
jgi:hypothetical protein